MACEVELGVTEKELNLFPEQLENPTSNIQKKIPSLLDIKVYPTPSLVHAARRQNTKRQEDQRQERKDTHPNGIRRKWWSRQRKDWHQKRPIGSARPRCQCRHCHEMAPRSQPFSNRELAGSDTETRRSNGQNDRTTSPP